MARVFVSGSSTGLGLMAVKELLAAGDDVIFHARNSARAKDIAREVPGAAGVVVGDIDTVAGTIDIATRVNALGSIDAAIHNAGLGADSPFNATSDGIPDVFAVNVLAPYILTSRINSPTRLVYVSSDMHYVSPDFDDPLWRKRRWKGYTAYSESKFYVTALAFAIARLRPDIRSNAVDPGWVPTRMGGRDAPDDLSQGARTQVALASENKGRLSKLSGQFLYHMEVREPQQGTRDVEIQDRLLALCQDLSGVSLPKDCKAIRCA